MIRIKNLLTEETFTATNKASGKTSVFKSKDSRDAAIKAGTHAKIDDKGNKTTASKSSKINIFDKPSKEEPKSSSTTSTPSDMGVDSVVYNKRTKTVGIVRLGDERGETKTDADGNVNTSELEPYNPMKYPHQKDAKVAPSTKKEIDSRGLWKPFAQSKDATSSEPKQAEEPKKDNGFQTPKRQGNPQVNKAVRAKAESLGITPQKLGNEQYRTKMMQAAVEALTDSNFHQEARELVAKLEGKPELAERPEYPSPSDPQFREKMAAISAKYDSVYSESDTQTDALAHTASQEAGWDGVDAVDGIVFAFRMNGFHKEAALIQSIFDDKPYMKNEGRISLSNIVNEIETREGIDIAHLTGLRPLAVQKFIDDNNIDARKLLAYLKIKGPKTLSNRMDIATAIVGKPGNKFSQGIIKAFSK